MSKKNILTFATAALWLLVCLINGPVFTIGPSFHPDGTFTGSTITGWHVLGQADWRAENGELIGTPKQPTGGWLVLDRSFQDVGAYREGSVNLGTSERPRRVNSATVTPELMTVLGVAPLRGRLFNVPTYRWIPAGSHVSVEYWAITQTTAQMPKTLEWPWIFPISLPSSFTA